MYHNNRKWLVMKEIRISDFGNIGLASIEDNEAKTGCTVIYFKDKAMCGVDISGGGPASRETPLCSSLTADNPLDAICLSGGSAYGLACSDGIMKCLESHNIGYNTGNALVPLVCQSCIYDLGYGSSLVRPDSDMGYRACFKALEMVDEREGNVGAGCGASVGKALGMACASKSGLGIYAIDVDGLKIGAIVVVNALGDIFDPATGKKVAGLKDHKRERFIDINEVFIKMLNKPKDLFNANTTIGCIITNAKFDKAKLNKIAQMTRNAYARCIDPVGTMADGDSIYAASVGSVEADVNLVGTLSAKVMEKAIIRAVEAAKISDEEFLRYV